MKTSLNYFIENKLEPFSIKFLVKQLSKYKELKGETVPSLDELLFLVDMYFRQLTNYTCGCITDFRPNGSHANSVANLNYILSLIEQDLKLNKGVTL